MLKSLRLGATLVTIFASQISTAFLTAPASASTKWVKVSTSEDNSIFYVDTTSIQGNGRFRYFWKNITLGSPDTDFTSRPAYTFMSYHSVDCETFTYRTRIGSWHDQNGKVLREFNYGEKGELRQANSGTSFEDALEFVCSSAGPVATPVFASTTGSSVNQAFVEDYKQMVMTNYPETENILLAYAQKNSDSIVFMAKNYCELLISGLSQDEIMRIDANNIVLEPSPQIRELLITSAVITNVLAPKHYCPEFASR